VIGSDSHTCTAGAIGAFAFGVGSTDVANAWYTHDIRVVVPASVKVTLRGRLPAHVSAKDVMLKILADPYMKAGGAIGQVLEFTGDGVTALNLDERATLTNMAVEGGATTGLIAGDAVVRSYLVERERWTPALEEALALASDAGATYAHSIDLDLATLRPMVALPGDPRNGIFLDQLEAETGGPVRIHRALRVRGCEPHQPELWGVHPSGTRGVRDQGPGHGQRHQPQLPRSQRPRQRVSSEPARGGRERHRGVSHRAMPPAGDAPEPSCRGLTSRANGRERACPPLPAMPRRGLTACLARRHRPVLAVPPLRAHPLRAVQGRGDADPWLRDAHDRHGGRG
jgi:hypothetical protein